jgi:polysaccharide pyruvyl transferase WcaK-like protein
LKKPVIALSYHPKIEALMADAGQERYCLPIQRFDLQTLKERFIDLETDGERIRWHFEHMVERRRLALEEQYARVFQRF